MIKQAQVQIVLLAISIFVCEPLPYPEKTADILWPYHWFPGKMKSQEPLQKFHIDDVPLHRSG